MGGRVSGVGFRVYRVYMVCGVYRVYGLQSLGFRV